MAPGKPSEGQPGYKRINLKDLAGVIRYEIKGIIGRGL